MKKLFLIISFFSVIILILFFLRGNEDTWICDQGVWVAHGHPSFEKPITSCNGKTPLPKNEVDCLKVGGIWKKLGPDPVASCNIKALDRGNLCSDSSQCEGTCLANLTKDELRGGMSGKQFKRHGQCSVWRVTLGCQGVVKNGIASIICID